MAALKTAATATLESAFRQLKSSAVPRFIIRSPDSLSRSPFLLSVSRVAFPLSVAVSATAVPLVAAASSVDMGVTEGTSDTKLPQLLTEFMVDMKCESCVKNVRKQLEPLEGINNVDISLESQVVRILGSLAISDLEAAIKKSGRKARLIGQGDPEQLQLTAAVAEFKGPQVHGVVRFAQVSMEQVRVEAQFDGFSPNSTLSWSVNTYGDLTSGADSTGPVYDSKIVAAEGQEVNGPAGDLGVLETNDKGHASYVGTSSRLQVWDLIGRSVAVYAPAASDGSCPQGLAAAVIARSAGVGQNYKQLCTCDGTVIWEATPSDYVQQGALKEA